MKLRTKLLCALLAASMIIVGDSSVISAAVSGGAGTGYVSDELSSTDDTVITADKKAMEDEPESADASSSEDVKVTGENDSSDESETVVENETELPEGVEDAEGEEATDSPDTSEDENIDEAKASEEETDEDLDENSDEMDAGLAEEESEDVELAADGENTTVIDGWTITYEIYNNSNKQGVEIVKGTSGSGSLSIPNKIAGEPVKYIRRSAFSGEKYLTSVTLPDTLLWIDYGAFKGTGLKEITIPASVETIDTRAFDEIYKIDFTVDSKNQYYYVKNNALYENKYGRPKCLIYKHGNDPLYISKDTYDVGYGAIMETYSYELEEGNTMLTLKDGVLFTRPYEGGAPLFRLVAYPHNKTEKIYTIPEGTQYLGAYAFYGNNYIEEFNSYPSSFVELNSYCFSGMNALRSVVVIPNTGSHNSGSTPNDIVSHCKNLTDIYFDSGVEKIGDGSIQFVENMSALKLYIPKTLKRIGNQNNFGDGYGNIHIYYEGTAADWDKIEIPDSYTKSSIEKADFTYNYVMKSKIRYVLNGGTNNPANPTSYTPGDVIEFAAPIRAGKVFYGWYLDAAFKEKITSTEGHSGLLTLYAKWGDAPYTIFYDMRGGVNHPDNPDQYESGTKVTLKNPTRTGYKFVGWFTSDRNKKVTTLYGGNYNIYAVWSAESYKITYSLNGGAWPRGYKPPTSYNIDTPDITWQTPTKACYHFTGWYSDKACKNKVSSIPKGSSGNVTLYAGWLGYKYSIIYHVNQENNNTEFEVPYIYGQKYQLYDIAFVDTTNYCLDFTGWTSEKNGSGKKYANKATISNLSKIDNDTIHLYAQWKEIEYTIAFNSNGGKGSVKSIKVKGETTVSLPTNNMSRTGYSPNGWKDSKGRHYKNGEKVTALTGKNKATVTFYADWEPNTYTIKFNSNGGVVKGGYSAPKAIECKYDENVILPNTNAFEREGYKAVNWNTKADRRGTTYPENCTIRSKATGGVFELYVQWFPVEPSKYLVIYKSDGADGRIADQKIGANSHFIVASSGFTKKGYYIDYWTDESGNKFYPKQDVKVTSSDLGKVLILKAHWKEIQYSIKFDSGNRSATGKMDTISGIKYSEAIKLPTCGYKLDGKVFDCWKCSDGKKYENMSTISMLSDKNGATITMTAQWKLPFKYQEVNLLKNLGIDNNSVNVKGYGQGNYHAFADGTTFTLGNGGATFTGNGCRVCSTAFLMHYFGGEADNSSVVLNKYEQYSRENPDLSRLVMKVNETSSYFIGSDIKELSFMPAKLTRNPNSTLVGARYCDSGTVMMEKMYELLASGSPIMANIGGHWIVVYGYKAGNEMTAASFYVFDPAGGGAFSTLDVSVKAKNKDVKDPVKAVWIYKK